MGYPNPAANDAPAWTGLRFGFRVDRDAATLPATTATPYFTVAGGRVAAFFLGEVTTVVQVQANNAKLVHNPTSGTDSDLCAVLDITGDEVGTLYSITGTPATAMLGAGQTVRLSEPVVLKPGTVDFSCSATNTGATKWTCWWVPIDEGATVAAA